MSDQTVIYLLAIIGWAGIIWTMIRTRSTTMQVWWQEKRGGIIAGFLASATIILIGPGDNVDLGGYMARTWAAGIPASLGYLLGANTPSKHASERREKMRKA